MLTTNPAPGTPNWLDIGSPDPDRTAAFYSGVFGWDARSFGPGDYTLFLHEGKAVGAVGALDEGASSAWTIYFHSPDVSSTAQAARDAGGHVRLEPIDVPGGGRLVQLTDPGGAEFAAFQPGENAGLELVTEPGSLAWTELHSPEPDTARAFYRAVLGWDATDMPMAGGHYTVFTPAGGDENSSFGGVAPLQEGHSPHWLPYIEVADTDRTVEQSNSRGGKVVMPPTDYEGVGRMAWLADPFGARFAVITSSP
ncbi:MAG: VOC family protein [Saccharothrix sp.]|nr:VOC family protein [Saccharothrix sp.]